MDDTTGARKKVFGRRPLNNYKSPKDRDEDLLLFREMHRREKDRVVSLLQPVSVEFEVNCEKLTVYGGGIMAAPGKKGPVFDILAESGKNDYDWLKTPPATPLFPSLEMEANLPDLVVQREIPILQPLTRFSGKSKEIGKSKVLPRYSTPKGRPSVSVAEKKTLKSAPAMMNQSCTDLNVNNSRKTHSLNAKSLDSSSKERQMTFLAANLSKSMGSSMDSNNIIKATKPKSRTVSPSSVRSSRIPADQIPGLSVETPTNLKKTHDRSVSASRGRTTTTIANFNTSGTKKKQEPITRTIRQSCSPSVTRGRKQEDEKFQLGNSNNNSSSRRTQVLGSRMVDRFLNARNMSNSEEKSSNKTQLIMNTSMNESTNTADDARRTSIEERQSKTKFKNTSIINEGSAGYGRFMSKSSLDMALIKQMEIQKDSGISSKKGTTISRRSSSVSKGNPIS